jgi:hypothetical protein
VKACFSSTSDIASSFMWNLLNHETGRNALTSTAWKKDNKPMQRQMTCSYQVSGQVLTGLPPY